MYKLKSIAKIQLARCYGTRCSRRAEPTERSTYTDQLAIISNALRVRPTVVSTGKPVHVLQAARSTAETT